jgi:hypothetical protein
MHIDDATLNAIYHFECPHTLWTKICVMVVIK